MEKFFLLTDARSARNDAIRVLTGTLGHILAFSAAMNLLLLALPVLMIQIFDRVLVSHSIPTLWVLSTGALLAITLMAALDFIRSRLAARIALRFENQLSRPLFERGATNELGDLSQIRSFLSGSAFLGLIDLPFTPFFIALVFVLSPTLGWITLAGALSLVCLALLGEISGRRGRIRMFAVTMDLRSFTRSVSPSEQVSGQHNQDVGYVSQWSRLHSDTQRERLACLDHASTFAVIGRYLRMTLHVGILAFAAGLVIEGAITPGVLIAASIIAARAFAPVERFQDTWHSLVETLAAYTRLSRSLDRQDASSDQQITDNDELSIIGAEWRRDKATKSLFRDLSFNAKPGEMIGITGPSGTGKSLLAAVIAGHASLTDGVIRLGAIPTSHVQNINRIDFVKPDTRLPAGTIAQVIASHREATFHDVVSAARMVGAEDAIKKLEHGYASPATSSHASNGLKQQLRLAQVAFRQPKLVVLDEPYTFLDNAGVEAMMRTVTELQRNGSIVVIVSQRPSILAACSQIVVLGDDEGRVLEHQPRPPLRLLSDEEETTQIAAAE